MLKSEIDLLETSRDIETENEAPVGRKILVNFPISTNLF